MTRIREYILCLPALLFCLVPVTLFGQDTVSVAMWQEANRTRNAAQLLVKNIPLVTTVEIVPGVKNWETGVTLVNTTFSAENIVISRIEYIDKDSRAQDIGFGFNQVLKPGDRWSRLLSEIVGKNKDGQVNVYIIASRQAKFAAFAAIFVDPENFQLIEARDITSIDITSR